MKMKKFAQTFGARFGDVNYMLSVLVLSLVTVTAMVMVMVMVMVAVMIVLLAEMRNIAQTLGASSVEEQLDFEARYEFVSTTSSKVDKRWFQKL